MDLPRLFQLEPPPDLQPDLAQWFQGELGQDLLKAEKALLDDILPELFGYHAVQLGQVSGQNLLTASPIRHRTVVAEQPSVEGLSPLVAHPEQLPFAADTMDLVLVHHGVDTAVSPHALLREASRVLISGGHLLVVGFNPWSLWGLWRLLRFPWTRAPWLRRYVSPQRLADWMSLLDFDVVGVESAFFVPPLGNDGVRRHLSWLERLGQRYWSQAGASYVLLARKHESCLTPIRKRMFAPQRALAPVFVEPQAGRDWSCDERKDS
jgi:SAM-dependent methyltransferase